MSDVQALQNRARHRETNQMRQRLSRQVGVDAASRDALKGGGRVRKYRNQITYIGEERFDSKKEARRFVELTLLQRAGAISGLERQVPYTFTANEVKICKYLADFTYIDTKSGKLVVEDVKGHATPVYRLKKQLMLAFYGIAVVEI